MLKTGRTAREGQLWVEINGVLGKSWKSWQFSLAEGIFKYRGHRRSEAGEIHLAGSEICYTKAVRQRPFVFRFNGPHAGAEGKVKLILAAESKFELDSWVSALERGGAKNLTNLGEPAGRVHPDVLAWKTKVAETRGSGLEVPMTGQVAISSPIHSMHDRAPDDQFPAPDDQDRAPDDQFPAPPPFDFPEPPPFRGGGHSMHDRAPDDQFPAPDNQDRAPDDQFPAPPPFDFPEPPPFRGGGHNVSFGRKSRPVVARLQPSGGQSGGQRLAEHSGLASSRPDEPAVFTSRVSRSMRAGMLASKRLDEIETKLGSGAKAHARKLQVLLLRLHSQCCARCAPETFRTLPNPERAELAHHGQLVFAGRGLACSPYLHLAADPAPAGKLEAYAQKVTDFMNLHWGLPTASVLISITGSAQDFSLSPKLHKAFSQGLARAVKATNAWVFTGVCARVCVRACACACACVRARVRVRVGVRVRVRVRVGPKNIGTLARKKRQLLWQEKIRRMFT